MKFFQDEMDNVAKIAEKKSAYSEESAPLNITHVQGAFVVLILLISGAVLVFFVELLQGAGLGILLQDSCWGCLKNEVHINDGMKYAWNDWYF